MSDIELSVQVKPILTFNTSISKIENIEQKNKNKVIDVIEDQTISEYISNIVTCLDMAVEYNKSVKGLNFYKVEIKCSEEPIATLKH